MRKLYAFVAVLTALIIGESRCSAQFAVFDPANLAEMVVEHLDDFYQDVSSAESLKELYDAAKKELDELSQAVDMLRDVSNVFSSLRNVVDMSEDLLNNQRDLSSMVQYFHVNGTYSEYQKSSAYLKAYTNVYKDIYRSYENNVADFKKMSSPTAIDYVNFVRELTEDMERSLHSLNYVVNDKFMNMYYTSIARDISDRNIKALDLVFY